ncbi:MAG: hypothetical protein ACJ786_09300 [Catenulispora sp.]
MSKSEKKSEAGAHVAKADVRHRYQVAEFADFTRREVGPDGTEQLKPRIAVLTPAGGGKQVQAYVPGNLDAPLEVGTMVMCRPYDKGGNKEASPVKFRITNVIDAASESDALSAAQNAQLAGRIGAEATPMDRQEADTRR